MRVVSFKLKKLLIAVQFLINKYSLIYTCWTLLAWEGICTTQCHVQKKYRRG
jgi:hypothetical protein